jgi:glutamine amidotransferase
MVREFFTHANKNPHGWGFADFSGAQTELLRCPEPANRSTLASQLLAQPLTLANALVHIRMATVGQIELDNCHPFVAADASGRKWTLIHKGTVFDYSPLDPYFTLQQGSTDSERILLYLIDQINRAGANKATELTAAERFAVFERLTREISVGACLNLIVFDGEQFFLHANYKNAIRLLHCADCALFCTSALTSIPAQVATSADERAPEHPQTGRRSTQPHTSPVLPCWEDLPLCTAFAYRQGRLIRQGQPHTHEYFDNEEDTRYLYQDFAAL